MAAKFWQRIFCRKLYTVKDMKFLLQVLLGSTYDQQAVHDAINEIDKFDAGAVDDPLREHIMRVFTKLRTLDKADDKARLDRWMKYLR